MVSNSVILFQTQDAFESTTCVLSSTDVCNLGQVCKSWAEAADQPGIWRQHFLKEKIPFVEGSDRNYKGDFKILFPITLRGKKIEKFLGEFIGEIPKISLEWFNKLSEPDPFEPGKTMAESFVIVVEPQAIKRTFSKDVSATLDEQGYLAIALRESEEETETEIEIPFNLMNLKTLSYYPLLGKTNAPVFYHGSVKEAFHHCPPSPGKVNLYFMRKVAPKQTLGKQACTQNTYLEKKGFQMVSLRTLALFNTVRILEEGAPPNRASPKSCVRTSDSLSVGCRTTHYVIGNFIHRRGVEIICKNTGESYIGAIPAVPMAARTLKRAPLRSW